MNTCNHGPRLEPEYYSELFQVSMRQPVMGHYSNDPALGRSRILVITATYLNLNLTVNVLLVSFISRTGYS